MKKFLCMAIILSILALCGCAKTSEYSVLVYDFSDSPGGPETHQEYGVWFQDRKKDFSRPEKLSIQINGEEVVGEYEDSGIVPYNYYPTHRYNIDKDDRFEVDSEQRLISYYWGKADEDESGVMISEEESIAIAKEFLSKIIDIKDYVVEASYSESWGFYDVTFTKYVGSYRTADKASFWVTKNGKLHNFRSTMLGRIPTDAKPDFDMAAVTEQVTARLDEMYAKAKTIYDKVEYSDYQYILTMVNETDFALVCTVQIECIDYIAQYEQVIPGLVQFVIQ